MLKIQQTYEDILYFLKKGQNSIASNLIFNTKLYGNLLNNIKKYAFN